MGSITLLALDAENCAKSVTDPWGAMTSNGGAMSSRTPECVTDGVKGVEVGRGKGSRLGPKT
jgi:hypothetical protein